jgi:hypothetical protein
MAKKPARRSRGTASEQPPEPEQVRPKGPAAVGVQKHQGTRTFRRQRSS